ncbi:hypothetical protein FVEG_15454 [Fusarium verticillioides 7600]|uniref:Uncharacterized protein n=1 Tax=Gibberella moniliformis (strain M3125 / FGSC 7600) TaxID=334819 RepID=W7M4U0_GIBM7|nr:hypothetical protein FVEG_15454 [Fusarium verticillioides 7600]EWG42585.1 hypothetical protein FVEG_15454 [Fusarium verticillioides 7600]
MSNLTKITDNFAVASARRVLIGLIYFNGMSRLMLEPWIDPTARDDLIVLHRPAWLVYERKRNAVT